MNILFCSAGRRVKLIDDFKKTNISGKIVATDMNVLAPAIYAADQHYIVGPITSDGYIDELIAICMKEKIQAITTLIDPEIEILAKNRRSFEDKGVLVLAPDERTAALCFDKWKFIRYLNENGINTVRTWKDMVSFQKSLDKYSVSFPVFVKPRTGSGSVGARKIDTMKSLLFSLEQDTSLIIQEYMGNAVDIDADVYVDTISHKAVSIFTKRKLEMKIGGASKTVSFKDDRLIKFIHSIVSLFTFNGPVDMDFFYQNGEYYLSEINPRFGGAYVHAFACGIDFGKLIEKNIEKEENRALFENYEDDMVMMMYDNIVMKKIGFQNQSYE